MSSHLKELERSMLEITQLTSNIATNYAELYRHLQENPVTIPAEPHPAVLNVQDLGGYLSALKAELRHHIENNRLRP